MAEELAQYCLVTGNVRVVGHSFAFPLNSGGGVAAVVSGVLAPGLDPQAMDLPRRLSALDRKLSPATVRLDTAVLFLAFRDSATVEERRRLAREMHDGVAQEMASLGYFVDTLVDQEPAGLRPGPPAADAARAADDGRRRGTPLGPDPAHRASARTTPSAPRSARWPATSARAAASRSTSPSTSRPRGCVPRSRASCCGSPRRP